MDKIKSFIKKHQVVIMGAGVFLAGLGLVALTQNKRYPFSDEYSNFQEPGWVEPKVLLQMEEIATEG